MIASLADHQEYGPQPHIPDLASTHPHLKHVPPDFKHHRLPAPHLSFAQPSLPFLNQEVIDALLKRFPNACAGVVVLPPRGALWQSQIYRL